MNSSTFCRMPWSHLQIEQNGSFRPCCRTTGFRHQSSVNIKDYQNSSELLALKNDLLAGRRSSSCSRCWSEDAAGLKSFRVQENEKFPQPAIGFGSVIQLKSIEIRFSNLCNLSCRMCSTDYSSKWVSEVETHFSKDQDLLSLKPYLGRSRSIDRLNEEKVAQIVDSSLSVEEIQISGGEPFLDPLFEKFLLELMALERTNKRIHVSTNGTVWRPEILKLLAEFDSVQISISVDGLGAVNDYIRSPSKWVEISKNLDRFAQWSSKFELILAPTVNIYNVLYLKEFFEHYLSSWKDSFSLKGKFNFQTYPDWQSLRVLSAQCRDRLVKQLTEVKVKNIEAVGPENFDALIGGIIHKVSQIEQVPDLVEKFKSLNPIYDRVKGKSLQLSLPKLYEMIYSAKGAALWI